MTLTNQIQELKDIWTALFPAVPMPEDSRWALWFLKYGAVIVQQGIVELAAKHRNVKGEMTPEHMGKFASAVMKRLSYEAQQREVKVSA